MTRSIRNTKAIICILVLSGCMLAPPAASASAEIVWLHSLAETLKQASAGDKLIIVDLVADWCGWCKLMEKETWAQPQVSELAAKYIFLKLDIDKDPEGTALARRFKVASLPTVLLLTSGGNEFERFQEFLPAAEFLQQLAAALANPKSLGNVRAAHLKDPKNIELHFTFAYAVFDRGDYQESEQHFAQIIEQDPKNQSTRTDASMFYLAACKGSRADAAGSLALLERLKKDMPESKIVPSTYLLAGQVLLRAGRRAEARQQVQTFLDKYPDHQLVYKAKELLAQIGNQ